MYSTSVGYVGGYTKNPTYEEVCSGMTGHTEAVQVAYDPTVISFADLLAMYFTNHDPTQGMRQGNDAGTQYRSGVYCKDKEQYDMTLSAKKAYQEALGSTRGEITSEIPEDFNYAVLLRRRLPSTILSETGEPTVLLRATNWNCDAGNLAERKRCQVVWIVLEHVRAETGMHHRCSQRTDSLGDGAQSVNLKIHIKKHLIIIIIIIHAFISRAIYVCGSYLAVTTNGSMIRFRFFDFAHASIILQNRLSLALSLVNRTRLSRRSQSRSPRGEASVSNSPRISSQSAGL